MLPSSQRKKQPERQQINLSPFMGFARIHRCMPPCFRLNDAPVGSETTLGKSVLEAMPPKCSGHPKVVMFYLLKCICTRHQHHKPTNSGPSQQVSIPHLQRYVLPLSVSVHSLRLLLACGPSTTGLICWPFQKNKSPHPFAGLRGSATPWEAHVSHSQNPVVKWSTQHHVKS